MSRDRCDKLPTRRTGVAPKKSVFEILKDLQQKHSVADQQRLAKLLAERPAGGRRRTHRGRQIRADRCHPNATPAQHLHNFDWKILTPNGRLEKPTLRLSTMTVSTSSAGSCFSSDSAPGPLHHGFEDEVEQSFRGLTVIRVVARCADAGIVLFIWPNAGRRPLVDRLLPVGAPDSWVHATVQSRAPCR